MHGLAIISSIEWTRNLLVEVATTTKCILCPEQGAYTTKRHFKYLVTINIFTTYLSITTNVSHIHLDKTEVHDLFELIKL